jgi:hypothetical protein
MAGTYRSIPVLSRILRPSSMPDSLPTSLTREQILQALAERERGIGQAAGGPGKRRTSFSTCSTCVKWPGPTDRRRPASTRRHTGGYHRERELNSQRLPDDSASTHPTTKQPMVGTTTSTARFA